MSFILEALKKSEAERRQGEVPDLNSDPGVPSPRRRPLWPLLLTTALLLNGVVFGGWLLLEKEKPAEKPAGVTSQEAAPSSAEPSVAAAAGGRKERMPAPAAPPAPPQPVVAQTIAPPAEPTQSRAADEQGVATLQVAPAQESTPQLLSAPAAATAERPAPPRSAPQPVLPARQQTQNDSPPELAGISPGISPGISYPPLSELPADVRSGLPELNLQLHFYSPDATRRMVRLNGSNRREGSRGGDGLNVEEITPDGIRLSRDGVRFFLPTGHR